MSLTSQMLWEGRMRLRDWLPAARASIEGEAAVGVVEAISAVAKAQFAYVTEDNLEALLIYPAPKGGWHADILLKKVPSGVTNSFGTPINQPMLTRAKAEDAGRRLLQAALLNSDRVKAEAAPAPLPAFVLYDTALELAPNVLARATEALEMMPNADPAEGAAFAVKSLEAQLAAHFPKGFSRDAFARLPVEEAHAFFGTIHMAAVCGVFRYPLRVDGTPSGHTQTSEARH